MDSIGQVLRKLRRKIRHYGLRSALYVGLLKALGYHRWLNILRAHYVEEVDPAFVHVAPGYAGGFLGPGALATFSRDPAAGISAEAIRYAFSKGDKCYGFHYRGSLRAYGWYATTPTRVTSDLRVHFKRDYVYMYRGFTHASHRGRRLFPIGVTRALRHYRAIGYKGMVLYVEANNLDSLRSCACMGLRLFGSIYIAKLFGRYFIYATRGCARFGFRVEDVSGANADRYGRRAATTRPST